MASLYHHGSDYLQDSSKPTRVSIGFFVRISDEKLEEFFKKDLYKVTVLPADTKCIKAEMAFVADWAIIYSMVVLKCHQAILYFRGTKNIEMEKKACCFEIYLLD